MKKILIALAIAAFLFSSNISIAQITFKKVYEPAIGTQTGYLAELSNHNFFAGLAGGTGSGISLIDSFGNYLYQHTYKIDTLLALRRVKKYSDNLFYFCCSYYRDTCIGGPGPPNYYPVIGKMDSLGNILSANYYHINPDCYNFPGSFDFTNDGGVILGGPGEAGFYILKIDSNGNYVWSKHFGYGIGGVQFVKALPDNNFLFGMNTDSSGAAVAKLDSAGNFIWCKSYFRPKGYLHDCVVDFDGSYLISGYTDSLRSSWNFPPYPPWFAPKYFMLKLDTSGQVLWCKGYDSDNHWLMMQDSRIINTLDGNHLIYATVLTSNLFVPLLIKTDINGDTLWTRVHQAPQHWYFTSSIIATSDSGYLLDGFIHGPTLEGAFLYKTDSLGRTYCDEHQEPIYVYNLFPTDSDFTFTYITGGYGLPAFAHDTITSYPAVFTECITNVGIVSASKRNFSLYPNPTSGNLHIFREDPYTSFCYYSVYDSQGRLLIQQKFINGNKDTSIDLSKYGKGIYLIKITDGVEMVTKKVVVQ
ncbi:MAG TPA: T9SS type A sorting domain-containing protein [Bacteroidia bacterium]|nr:T9SS type A sorting domain-containing protein [Bacteroidia bacterium]